MLDVISTLLYLGAFIVIVTDVFSIPLKGVLATSGALAIVLGLALQSTLSDLFSGLLINATSPYRVGDWVTLEDSTSGEVVEITWRATHISRINRDTVVLPNSIIAKSRIVNHSVPTGAHATIAKFDADTRFRPSDVSHALELAIGTCVGVVKDPTPLVATKHVGRKTSNYEVTFFMNGKRTETEVLNKFYDAAHRHLESFSVLLSPRDRTDAAATDHLAYELIEAVGVFGMLTQKQRLDLASSLTRREYAPGQLLLSAGSRSESITIVAYGIVAVTPSIHADADSDIVRLGPREYFGEAGPIAGVSSTVAFVARSYVISYDLPAHAVSDLLRQHTDIAHALAAKLEAREKRGLAMIHATADVRSTEHGLRQWLHRCIESIHHTFV